MKIGEIVEMGGRKYVMTQEGLVPIAKNARPRAVFEDSKVIKAFRTGEKTVIELVKTIAKRGTESVVLYTLRKRIQLKDREVVAKAIAVEESIAKKLFQL